METEADAARPGVGTRHGQVVRTPDGQAEDGALDQVDNATGRRPLFTGGYRSSVTFARRSLAVCCGECFRLRRVVAGRGICRGAACTTFQTACGCFAATCNRMRAGPSGVRRPRSQLRSVATLMPNNAANVAWDS